MLGMQRLRETADLPISKPLPAVSKTRRIAYTASSSTVSGESSTKISQLKINRASRPRPLTVSSRPPQRRSEVLEPTPAQQRAPKLQPQQPKYPQAKRKAKQPKKKPDSESRIRTRVASRHTPSERSSAFDVSTNVSWTSLPASGPAMNAYLLIEFAPNGRLSPIDDQHNLTVIFDVSHSMPLSVESVLSAIIKATQQLQANDRLVLVAFADAASVLPGDRKFLKKEVTRLNPYRLGNERLGTGTTLRAGIRSASQEKRSSKPDGMSLFVVITDGRTEHEKSCLQACQAAGVPISALGVGADCAQPFLKTVADSTNGRFHLVDKFDLLPQVLTGEIGSFLNTVTQNNQLKITLREDVKVNNAYLLKPRLRDLGKPDVRNKTVVVPVGDLRKGETASVVLQVTLPSHSAGTASVASASVEYTHLPLDRRIETPPQELTVNYSTGIQPKPNAKTRNIQSEVQRIISGSRGSRQSNTSLKRARR